MTIALKEQNSIYHELLNIEGFYKFVDNLGKMKNPSHYNPNEYATMVYLDKHNIIHAKVIDLSSNIDISLNELEVETGEKLIEKKLGLPVRKYKILKNYKQAEKFYMEAISEAKDNQAPKFKIYLDKSFIDSFNSFDKSKSDFLLHGRHWRNPDRILNREEEININSRFDMVFVIEFLKKASELNVKELKDDNYSWVYRDLMEVALHKSNRELLGLSEEEEKDLNIKYLNLVLNNEDVLGTEQVSSVMYAILNVIKKREDGYFACLTDKEFNDVISKNFDVSTDLGKGLIELINKEWNSYAPYEKYLGVYKNSRDPDEILDSIFPQENKSKYVASIDFNPDEAWGYASNKLRGYYSKYRSTNEFKKIFEIVALNEDITNIEVFNHDYKRLYTAIFKSDSPIDERKLQNEFLNVLKIAGEVHEDPELPKAKIWDEVTDGLSDEHFKVISERNNDTKNDFKVVQRKRF